MVNNLQVLDLSNVSYSCFLSPVNHKELTTPTIRTGETFYNRRHMLPWEDFVMDEWCNKY